MSTRSGSAAVGSFGFVVVVVVVGPEARPGFVG
jgi:hypothetical protein